MPCGGDSVTDLQAFCSVIELHTVCLKKNPDNISHITCQILIIFGRIILINEETKCDLGLYCTFYITLHLSTSSTIASSLSDKTKCGISISSSNALIFASQSVIIIIMQRLTHHVSVIRMTLRSPCLSPGLYIILIILRSLPIISLSSHHSWNNITILLSSKRRHHVTL